MGEEVNPSKQRLRPWLEAQLDNGSVEGLYWLDDQRTTFRIPWYHQGRTNWNEERGRIFKV